MTARWKDVGFDIWMTTTNFLLTLPGHALRIAVLHHLGRVSVGTDTAVERRVRLTTTGGVVIGVNCNINAGVLLDGRGGLDIGDTVNISHGAILLTADHDPVSPTFEGRHRPVRVGSRSWIATGAFILPGSVVGEGAVVGAGSVVSGDVPPWTVVAGSPAKAIRPRSKDAQTRLPSYRRWFH